MTKSIDLLDLPSGWNKLRADGMSAQEWAKAHGFSPQLVYAVLRGDRKCFRGKSHQIAVLLGLKSNPSTLSMNREAG